MLINITLCFEFQEMYAGQQAANQNELNSNLLKSQLAAAVHSRSQSLSGLQPVSCRVRVVPFLKLSIDRKDRKNSYFRQVPI